MRIFDIFRAISYDIVFVHRETFPLGAPWFETFIAKVLNKTIIFDFDDAIYLPNSSESNRFVGRFKQPDKTKKIIKLCSLIIAGNSYLESYALKYNGNVTVLPTVIDTETYKPQVKKKQKDIVTIGWMGSGTTVEYLKIIDRELKFIDKKFPNLQFTIVGGDIDLRNLKRFVPKEWFLEEEIDVLQQFDIGLMPMPNNAWAEGKCGFKAIMYMSMGIPTIASNVGINGNIITDGQNGFLAKDSQDWINKLSSLIDNRELRIKIGIEGRKTVEERYSLKKNGPIFAKIIQKIYRENHKCVE